MNRPKLEAYTYFDMATYVDDLEAYCDELESKLLKGDCITHYEKEITKLEAKAEMCEKEVFAITKRNIQLEKALDKACVTLDNIAFTYCAGYCDMCLCKGMFERCEELNTSDAWKRWCLKDE